MTAQERINHGIGLATKAADDAMNRVWGESIDMGEYLACLTFMARRIQGVYEYSLLISNENLFNKEGTEEA